jgi:hypothetical protein
MLLWLLIKGQLTAPQLNSRLRALDYLYVVLGTLGVGALDHFTGSDVHVVSLYFMPLAFAGCGTCQ